jgi:autotransporter translocation and assembly factor TamB
MNEKGRKTKISAWLRGGLWALVVLLAVHAGVFVWLQTDSARRFFKGLIIRSVENNLDATCRIDGIGGNLMRNLDLSGIELKAKDSQSHLLNVDHMRIRFSLLPLLVGKIWISHLEIRGADVNLEKTQDGAWNYEALVPADGAASKRSSGFFTPSGFFIMDIRRILIADGVFSILGSTDRPEVIQRIDSFECRAALSVGREISARIEHLYFLMDEPRVVVTNGSGDVRIDPDTGDLDIRNARLGGKESVMETDGRVLNYDPGDPGAFTLAFDAKGTIDDMNCRADLEINGNRMHAVGNIGIGDDRSVAVDLSARLEDVNPGIFPVPGFTDFTGNVNAEATVRGRYFREDGFSGEALVDMGPSGLAGYDISAASMKIKAEGPDLIVEKFKIHTPYGRAEGRVAGRGIMSSDQKIIVVMALAVDGMDPALLFLQDDISGDIHFTVDTGFVVPGDFDLNRTSGSIHVRMLPSVFMNLDIHQGDMEAAWSGDQIDLKRFSLSGDAGAATASGVGSWAKRSYDVNVSATLSDLNAIAPFTQKILDDGDLSGRASLVATLAGADGRLDLSAEIRGREIVFQDVSADRLDVDGRWQGAWEDFTLLMDVYGRDVCYKDVRISTLEMNSTWSPITADIELALNAASGEALTLSGSVADWAGPVGKIKLEQMIFTSENLPSLVSERPVEIIVSGDRVTLESLRLASGDASLEAGGTFAFSRPSAVSAQLALQNFDLQRISGFFDRGASIRGRVTADADLSGFADDPVIMVSARLDGGQYNGFVISEALIRSTYRDAKADMDLFVSGSGGKIMDARGTVVCRLALYPFGFSFDAKTLVFSAAVEDLAIHELTALMEIPAGMDGRVSGRVDIAGPPEHPAIDASVSISDVAYRKFALSKMTISADYRGENLSLQVAGYNRERKMMGVEGSVPLRLSLWPLAYEAGRESMGLFVDVDDVDITDIDALIEDFEYGITGVVGMKAEVGGTIHHPLVTGSLALREGTLRLKPQRLFYRDLQADLRFEPDLIEIVEIRIAEGATGILSLKGVVRHEGLLPGEVDIHAVGTDIQVPFYAGLTAQINPDLRFQGTWDAPVVTGDVSISRGRVNLDVLFSRQPSEIKVVQPRIDDNGVFRLPDETPPALAFVDPLRADVTITVPPGNVWLRGRDESIEITGRVNVTKEPGRSFIVYGPISAVRGTYQFRGKLFKITRGELNFIGQEVIDPPLDIQAETRIGDVRIIIYLTGTYERQTIRFESDPSMDEIDIISYLIFGRPQTSLTEGESFRAGEAALALTGQIAADELKDILGDRFRIDYINISAGSGGFQHGSLSMGKYLTPKVFVIYRQSFSTENPQQVEVYYEINRHFSLETQVTDEKTSAVDLIWKYEF